MACRSFGLGAPLVGTYCRGKCTALTCCLRSVRKPPDADTHFFYGAEKEPDVPGQLAEILNQKFPGTTVAGVYSQPTPSPSLEQEKERASVIFSAKPDVLWVGLGELRQVRWMDEHKNQLNVPVMVGVGTAFDILSGRKKQARDGCASMGWSGFPLVSGTASLGRRRLN